MMAMTVMTTEDDEQVVSTKRQQNIVRRAMVIMKLTRIMTKTMVMIWSMMTRSK